MVKHNFIAAFVCKKWVFASFLRPHEPVYIFILVHPVPISLCHLGPFLTMRSMSLFVCHFFPHFLSSVSFLPPLSVTVMLFQTYDDIDLENEPWYKFFSELEFGRPVSQGRSCSLNHNPAIGIHPLSPPHPCFFFMCTPIDWVGLVVWACGSCWVLWPPTFPPPLWRAVLCLCVAGFFGLVASRHWNVHTQTFMYWICYFSWFLIASYPKLSKKMCLSKKMGQKTYFL